MKDDPRDATRGGAGLSVTGRVVGRGTPQRCNLCGGTNAPEIFFKNGFSLVRCAGCGLVYVGNPPDAEQLALLYSFGAGYHTNCVEDDSADGVSHRRAAREYYAFLARHRSGGRLLDVGCSSGFFLRVARDAGWQTRGLEMSADTARAARERHGLDVLSGTLEETTFPENQFDAVTLWDVIEHVPNPSRTMAIVHRILKDDGIVALLTPNIEGLFPRMSYAAARVLGYWPHPEPPHHLFQFSKETARALATRAGFEVLEISDRRIPLSYTFGTPGAVMRSPKQLLYTAVFAPFAALGPAVGSGDAMFLVARKPKPSKGGAAE